MTTGQGNIGDREGAISAGFVAEFDAGVLANAGQTRTWLVTECALVVVEVRMTLGHCAKNQDMHGSGEKTPHR